MDISALYQRFIQSKGISTDTRTLEEGQLFVALKGPRFNGNAHVQQAFEGGAAGAIVDEPQGVINDQCYWVEDALSALQMLATHHRKQLAITVIAITGSNGKTTTKELAQAVMRSHYPTFATRGNLNNHIGLPLSVLSLTRNHSHAILELGDNHPGEVAMLCRICQPQYGLITNVGMDHLAGFGSMEANIAAKQELFDYLAKNGGTALLNPLLPYLSDMATPVPHKVSYGEHARYATQGELLHADPYVRFRFRSHGGQWTTVDTRLIGAYNYHNALAAVAIGQHFGIPDNKIAAALSTYIPNNNRSQIIAKEGYHILLDAYNANPSNVEAALESFAKMESPKKAIILGDMLELGPFEKVEHERIARLIQQLRPDRMALVGDIFAPIAADMGIQHFPSAKEARAWFIHQDWTGYWILIKGSRGIAMETIVH